MPSPEESAQFIYECLSNALSTDAETRQAAEASLRSAEEQQDYFASLANIAVASDADAEPNVRWLASVCGKNAVSRSWRRHARGNAVTDDEREFVRGLLLSSFDEPHSNIATQLSVWISYIARIDFPTHWPEVLAEIMKHIQSPQPRVMVQALTTLDMVLKQLSTRRLTWDRKAMFRQGPRTFSLLFELFISRLPLLNPSQCSADVVNNAFHIVSRCLKSFRRLIAYACEDPAHFPALPQLFSKFLEHSHLFMNGADGGSDLQRRLSHLTAKLVRVFQERHPIQFQPYLPTFLEHYHKTLISFNSEKSDDRVTYQVAFFLRNVIQCSDYGIKVASVSHFQKERDNHRSVPQENSAEACRSIVLNFFDESVTQTIVEAMIGKIFILNNQELETWANDPETLVREEEAAEWGTENLRHECEELFKILLLRKKQIIVPLVLNLAESVPKDKPLLLDACYRAVGRASYDVQGAFNIDSWLNHHLLHTLSANCSADLGQRIIQARTAWLVSQFADQLSRESRLSVYPLLVKLMASTDYDRVIALTAAKGMRYLIEDIGFVDTDFAPHLENCFTAYFRLIGASESFETKKDLLTSVSALVSQCRSRLIAPLLDAVASFLPQVWEDNAPNTMNIYSGQGDGGLSRSQNHESPSDSGSENLLRTLIVTLLTSLITKVGAPATYSEVVCRVVYPVLDFSLDPTPGKGGLLMMEDGCDLWCTVVAASTEYSDHLRNMYTRIGTVLEVDFSSLPRVLALTQSYALLGGQQFIEQHGGLVMEMIDQSIDSVRDRGCLGAIEVVDLLLRLFPGGGVRACVGILQKVVTRALMRNESHALIAAHLCLIARAIVSNIGDVEQLVFERSEDKFLEIIDVIIEYLDSMYRAPRRKLAMLAVCGLISRYHMSEKIRSRLPAVLNGIVQVLCAEAKASKRKAMSASDEFVAKFNRAAGREERAPEDAQAATLPEEERRRSVQQQDVEETMDLRKVCMDMLNLIHGSDSSSYEKVLKTVDPAIMGQLQELLQNVQ